MGYKIINKEILNETVIKMDIEAIDVARHAKAGQFIILRIDEKGERIPLTIADANPNNGLVTIIFQIVGLTTLKLSKLNQNDEILDFVGPLGKATKTENVKKALVIGGGVGVAIAYPICKQINNENHQVDAILGFRNKELVILEKEFRNNCQNVYIYSDDGSYQNKGFVTTDLDKIIQENQYDEVFCIGPLVMMKNVCNITKKYNLKTTVSMNPIMIDGTGMCGGCKLYIDNKVKFACIDGPDFDGFKVDFDSLILRNKIYHEREIESCNLYKEANKHE